MQHSIGHTLALLPTVLLAGALTLTVAAAPVAADSRPAEKIENATIAYQDLLDTEEIPDWIPAKAICIAVFPGVVKGAVGWGGHHGKGIISCRRDDRGWSAPAFFNIGGGSFGLQIGAEASDIVFFVMSERGARSLVKSKFTLGADASVAAGPVGRAAGADTDLHMKTDMLTYAKARGLYVGISLEGAKLTDNQKYIQRYYGKRIWPEVILFEHDVPKVPREAREFIDALP